MTPKATRALVPELRFPEFRDAGEWEEKTLSEACRVTQGGTPDTAATDLWGGSIQWLTPAEMEKGDSKYIAKTVRSITEKGLSNCSSELLPVNSVIISTRAPIGHLAINKEPMAINQGCRGLIPKTSFDAHFIYYFLAKSKTQLNDLGSGNTFKEISGKTLKEFLIAFPMLAEQQKIADCLSSIDDLITLETRKIDALKAHKKGLMQQLFPAEGETIPKLRFPEFRDAGEWEEKRLGEIGSVLMCKRIFAEETNDREGVPFFKIGTLGGIADSFISKQLFEEYRSKYNYPKKGEVLLTCSGTVGKCIPYDGADAYYQDSNIVWIANSTRVISNEFLFFKLSSVDWSRLNSTTITRIYGDDLRALSLVFPADPGEQQKIADGLSSVDDLITSQAQKLDALKAHKKGLLQQLFPSLEEARE